MLKVFIGFVLVLAVTCGGRAEAPQHSATPPDVGANPAIDALSATYDGGSRVSLDVRRLCAPNARLKYDEISAVMHRSEELPWTEWPLSDASPAAQAAAEEGSYGMTGFDGSAITLNVMDCGEVISSAPVRVNMAAGSGRGTGGGGIPGYVPAKKSSLPAVAPLRDRPTVARVARVHGVRHAPHPQAHH